MFWRTGPLFIIVQPSDWSPRFLYNCAFLEPLFSRFRTQVYIDQKETDFVSRRSSAEPEFQPPALVAEVQKRQTAAILFKTTRKALTGSQTGFLLSPARLVSKRFKASQPASQRHPWDPGAAQQLKGKHVGHFVLNRLDMFFSFFQYRFWADVGSHHISWRTENGEL